METPELNEPYHSQVIWCKARINMAEEDLKRAERQQQQGHRAISDSLVEIRQDAEVSRQDMVKANDNYTDAYLNSLEGGKILWAKKSINEYINTIYRVIKLKES